MTRDRVQIALVCERCESRNYRSSKVRKSGQNERLTLKKFCPRCNAHTTHRESR